MSAPAPQANDFSGMCREAMVPGGVTPAVLLEWELMHAAGDGRLPDQVAAIAAAAAAADGDATRLNLYRQLLALPVASDYAFVEPDELEEIRALRPAVERSACPLPYGEDRLYDRLYGAWLGRCAGCTLGGPSEAFRPWTRQRLKTYLQGFTPSEWPVRDYLPLQSPTSFSARGWKTDATRGNIGYAPQDDDLTHTMLAQIALGLAPHPLAFETQDIARTWFCHLPVRLTEGGTALLAYRNLLMRYPMRQVTGSERGLDWIDWQWVATHSNPYREDLDAALRADSYGYACPGLPTLAAELAWRDARASNVRNGIYCSMLYAAMIAAAFVLDDPEAIVRRGLAEIPATSRLYADALRTLEICREHGGQDAEIEAVHEALYTAFGDDHKHVSNNMSLVLSGLVCGGHDFAKVITGTVMGGWDCDTTAATAGSVAGCMLGAAALPGKWIEPLHDTVHGGIVGYQPIAISECARRSLRLATQVLERQSRERQS